jgi:hypothetical protein
MKINATVCDDEGEVHEGEAADNFEIAREGGIYHSTYYVLFYHPLSWRPHINYFSLRFVEQYFLCL